jgi:uncharacterized protein Usg
MDTTILFRPEHHVLTTAEITYYFPDYPSLLQTYLWQDLDVPRFFPALKKFLAFWESNLDGHLHSVFVTCASVGWEKPLHIYADEFCG